MLVDPRAELLSRYLPAGWTLEEELAVLAGQPAEKQRVVEQRLQIIHGYLTNSLGNAAQAEAAAAQIGVGRRQFYSLVSKVRELGPSRALIPGFRNVARAAPSRDGLAEPAEGAIREVLAAEPDAKLSRIVRNVRAVCEQSDAPFPGETAIKRRVYSLRGAMPAPRGQFGAKLVVDQVALQLSVNVFGRDTLSVITLIIDRGTRLIAGFSLTAGDGAGLGIQQAVFDLWTRGQPTFANAKIEIAAAVEELTWVVPPGLEHTSNVLASALEESRRPKFVIMDSGPTRHGEMIMRLIGDRLPPFYFKRLARLDQDPPAAPTPGIPLEDAFALVSAAVSQWNARILQALVHHKRMNWGEHHRRLDRIVGDVRQMFDQVLDAVHDVRARYEP